MAKPMKDMKEPEGAKLSKFRVGYSVKWNFNGILEVEAENADDAEKQAQAQLDAQADDGEFDDTSDFRAEFDSADVLDTEEVKDDDDDNDDDDEGEIVKGGPEHGEEICTNCDHTIRYIREDGKRVVTCPECGAINPLCNECARHEKCSECEVSRMCEELNRQRADALPKPEEE